MFGGMDDDGDDEGANSDTNTEMIDDDKIHIECGKELKIYIVVTG